MTMPKFPMPLTLIVALAAAAAPAAAARPEPQTHTTSVPFTDLELTRYADRAILDARITRAARRVCGRNADASAAAALQCRQQAVRSARQQRNAAIARALQPDFAAAGRSSPAGISL